MQGFQSILQHSKYIKHKEVSDIRFSSTLHHLQVTASSSGVKANGNVVVLDPAHDDKVAAAEAMWLFKVVEKDMSFRDYGNTPIFFQNMFSDSAIVSSFSMKYGKASYIMQDGLGPLLASWLCESLSASKGSFTLMFDETTTLKNRKQMNILVRYCDENKHQILTT